MSVRLDQGQVFARRGELEIGVELRVVCPGAVFVRGKHHQIAAPGNHLRRELPLGQVVGVVGKIPTGEIHFLRLIVDDLDPIRRISIVVQQGGAVAGHEFADADGRVDHEDNKRLFDGESTKIG